MSAVAEAERPVGPPKGGEPSRSFGPTPRRIGRSTLPLVSDQTIRAASVDEAPLCLDVSGIEEAAGAGVMVRRSQDCQEEVRAGAVCELVLSSSQPDTTFP